jgi:ATP-dependent DNA helicase RecQ
MPRATHATAVCRVHRGSIIAYYQQLGRAGRGISNAIGILISGEEDDDIHEYFRSSAFPREHWVRAILDALEEGDADYFRT